MLNRTMLTAGGAAVLVAVLPEAGRAAEVFFATDFSSLFGAARTTATLRPALRAAAGLELFRVLDAGFLPAIMSS